MAKKALDSVKERLDTRYDLAVAFLEGGSTYYVADYVQADKKAAFVHVDYRKAGYSREMDRDCYRQYDKIFPVSDEVKASFLAVYPECAGRTEVFHNIINRDKILARAQLPGGFSDGFDGMRLLTVGRLMKQKALEVSIEAMRLLKAAGERARWYVLGEGDQRRFLEERIRTLGLEEDFLLLGAVDNPYPYMRQADLYVHASRFEGKSIAIQEAQILDAGGALPGNPGVAAGRRGAGAAGRGGGPEAADGRGGAWKAALPAVIGLRGTGGYQ